MIAIVDYGAGNLASVVKAVRHLRRECVVTTDANEVRRAQQIVIPGVGNFKATAPLARGDLGSAVRQSIAEGKPLLGICLGLQWLFAGSTEAPELPGLGIFEGTCTRFSDLVKSPHVGWDRIEVELRFAPAQDGSKWSVRLFHSFLPPPLVRRNGRNVRVRRAFHCGGGAGQSLRCAVSSGEVGRCRAENTGELLWTLRH